MICPKLAEGEVFRATRVDECGRPVEGTDNALVDDCFTEVAMAPNVEEGTEISFRAASGRSCGFKRACVTFNGYDVTIQFFAANPALIDIFTDNPLYLDFAGAPIGWDDCAIACRTGFAFELWQNVVGEECPADGEGVWFYWLLPWITNARLGDLTVNNEGVTFTLTGSTRAGGGWQLGPWDVVAQDALGTAGPLLTELGTDCHRRGFLTTIEPPTASCDPILVPANNS